MSPEFGFDELPRGTVTFLFTDIEDSTALLTRIGRERYRELLAEHAGLLRETFEAASGHVVDTQGDAFFVVFPRAGSAVEAAVAAQAALAANQWPDGAEPRVRIGVHTGEAELHDGRYVGLAVHKAQRVCSAADGGQILLSSTTRDVVEDSLPGGRSLRDAGMRTLKGIARPEQVWELVAEGAAVPARRRTTVARRQGGLPVRTVAIGLIGLVLVGLPLAAILVGQGAVGVVALVVLIVVLVVVLRR
jgi:class 3 adenylate cyclase